MEMEIRMGIKKRVYEETKQFEGFAIVDGVKKDLTPELISELALQMKEEKEAGKKISYIRFWLNDGGQLLNPF